MLLTVIDSLEQLIALKDYLQDKEYVAYDCETTGLSKRDEVIGFSVCAEEDKAFYVILQGWDRGYEQLVPKPYLLEAREFITHLQTKKLIMHNGVFDCSMAEFYLKVPLIQSLHTDTMILAHLLDENRKVGLKELASSLFGEESAAEQLEMKESVLANGGELKKSNYEMYKADPYIMGKYGAKDALLTYKLFLTLVPELFEQGLDKFFYEEESMPLLKGPTYDLNTTGFQVDLEALGTLKRMLIADCAEIKDFVYKEIDIYIKDKYPAINKKTTFNVSSTSQLSWLLFCKLGLDFETLTNGGRTICKGLGMDIPYTKKARMEFVSLCLDNVGKEYLNYTTKKEHKVKEPWSYICCNNSTLKKLSHKYVWLEKLLEYQKKTKLLKTYVLGIEKRMQYGIIQPSFLQHGTTSGRYASRSPNFQNLPRDDKQIKKCIISRQGKTFVGADYSQLEPRVFAFFSKDERLLSAFKGTDDFYSVIGMEVYGKTDCTPQKEGSDSAFGIKYKRLRDLSKVIALASTYGAMAKQLSPITGKSIEDTNLDISRYFSKFPRVKEFMLESHETVKKEGKVVNLFGRARRIRGAKEIPLIYGDTPHEELPYMARKMLNLSVNHRVQSTGASIVNRAAIRFYHNCKQAKIECKIVAQVHDSLVVECNKEEAEEVKLLLQDAMENTVLLEGIDLEAIPKIGNNLSEV